MKTFFRAFYKSATDPSYYKDVLAAKFPFSVKYYIVLCLILTVINTASGTIKYAPSIKRDLAKSANEITNNYPQDLILTISPAGITANKEFPLIVQTPSALRGLPKNLAVIDPKGEVGMLQKYNSLILINNSYVIVNNGNTIQTAPLKDFPTTSVDYLTIHKFTQRLLFLAQNAYLFTAGVILVVNLMNFFIGRIIYLIFFALVLRLVYKNVLISYTKSFQASMHSITLPLIINTTLGIAGIAIPFPAWFFLTHSIVAFYMLSRLEKSGQN